MSWSFDAGRLGVMPIRAMDAESRIVIGRRGGEIPYWRLLRSISKYGLRRPIAVRCGFSEEDWFEILDGVKRWRACFELGYSHVLVYNEGMVTDNEANGLALFHQAQPAMDEAAITRFVAGYMREHKDHGLPYPMMLKSGGWSLEAEREWQGADELMGLAGLGEIPPGTAAGLARELRRIIRVGGLAEKAWHQALEYMAVNSRNMG